MPKPRNGLTDKQERFCQEYIIDLNATQAAIRANYKQPGVQGCQNLKKLSIKNRIIELQNQLREKAIADGDIATPEEILKGYTRDIRFNPKKFYDENGKMIPVHELDDNVALSLYGVKSDKDGVLEYKYPDKNRCRDSVAKILGMVPKNGNGNGDTHIENLQININTQPVRQALEDVG